MSYILFVDSITSVNITPEYDFDDSGAKIESVLDVQDGSQYRYKFGDYRKIKFTLMWVTSADKYLINTWWDNNTNLTFTESGNTNSEVSVRLVNKSKPVSKVIKPYNDQFKGVIELRTY